jgi:galactokinase
MPNPASNLDSVGTSLRQRFQSLYAKPARIFLAPGRVNLIGEHTDYNDGFVMPVAIDSYTFVAVARRADKVLNAYSEHFTESVQFDLSALSGPPRGHWSDYVRGVAAVLQASGRILSGADLLIYSQLPLGAGLSSSASLEVSTALALMSASGVDVAPLDLAKICQQAEHGYAGARCGIMDQFIAVFGRAACALLLDCRSLEHQILALPGDVRIVICNSMVRHEHAAGEYNRRRADCETGVSVLQHLMPDTRALRDVSIDELQRHQNELPLKVYQRCRHVVSENGRVLEAAKVLRNLDLGRLGTLMYESHNSLRNDYEVSCRELDALVELASTFDGVYGARMTGGGFGGCTINMVRSNAVEDFRAHMTTGYKNATGITPEIYICGAAQGARAWQPSFE